MEQKKTKASHIGGAACQVLVAAPGPKPRPPITGLATSCGLPAGREDVGGGGLHQEHMQQHLIASPTTAGQGA